MSFYAYLGYLDWYSQMAWLLESISVKALIRLHTLRVCTIYVHVHHPEGHKGGRENDKWL